MIALSCSKTAADLMPFLGAAAAGGAAPALPPPSSCMICAPRGKQGKRTQQAEQLFGRHLSTENENEKLPPDATQQQREGVHHWPAAVSAITTNNREGARHWPTAVSAVITNDREGMHPWPVAVSAVTTNNREGVRHWPVAMSVVTTNDREDLPLACGCVSRYHQ